MKWRLELVGYLHVEDDESLQLQCVSGEGQQE